MTVHPLALIAALLTVSAVITVLCLNLLRWRNAYATQLRINAHNSRHAAEHEATLVAGILNSPLWVKPYEGELPPLNANKFSTLMDLYDSPEMMGYDIPAQVTIDNDRITAFYWKVTNVNELDDYVVARLILAGIL